MWGCFVHWNVLSRFIVRTVIVMTRSAFTVSSILLIISHWAVTPGSGVEGTALAAVRKSLLSGCLQCGREVDTHGLRLWPRKVVWEDSWAEALDLNRPTSVSAQRRWPSLKWPLTTCACQDCPSSSLECCLLCQTPPASRSHFPRNTHVKGSKMYSLWRKCYSGTAEGRG